MSYTQNVLIFVISLLLHSLLLNATVSALDSVIYWYGSM